MTGAGCRLLTSFDVNSDCLPATGTVNYSGTCPGVTNNQGSYTLTVPDWVEGPSDIAALEMPTTGTTGPRQQAANPKIYVFSVPIDASCTVASVTLPDVGANVAKLGAAHLRHGVPQHHDGHAAGRRRDARVAKRAGLDRRVRGADRERVHPAVGGQPGATRRSGSRCRPASAPRPVRRCPDPAVGSRLLVGRRHRAAGDRRRVASPRSHPAATRVARRPTPLTFNGSASVTLPEGGDIYSDPISLPFAVTPGQGILVSLYLENSSLPLLPLNDDSSGAMTWFAASGTPNETAEHGGHAVHQRLLDGDTVPVLTGVDVTTPRPAQATSPGRADGGGRRR